MAISFNQGGGNVFNFGNKSTQVNSENKKLLLNAGGQEINQGIAFRVNIKVICLQLCISFYSNML